MATDVKVAENAIKRYGYKRQLKKLAEELNELAVEVMHFENDKGNFHRLVDEFADVKFMMMQIQAWLDTEFNGTFTELVDLTYQYKVDRIAIHIDSWMKEDMEHDNNDTN